MKNYKRFLISSFLIILFFLFSLTLKIEKVNAKTIDYSSDESLITNITYSELISLLTNIDISQNESDYLNYINGNNTSLKINKLIPKSSVTFDLNGNDLSVHAYSYSYIDKDENVHIWVPKKISVGLLEDEPIFNGTYYNSDFIGIDSSENTINVKYECIFKINKDDCNELINKAYNDASYFVLNNVEETETELYNEKLKQFNKYLNDLNKYNSDLVVYQNYLIEKAKYDQEKNKYDEYLADLEKYNEELEAYEAYLVQKEQYATKLSLFQQYLNDLENYNLAYSEYETKLPAYNSQMEIIRHQLLVLDTIGYGMIFNPGDKQELRSIKDQILGDAVTNVLSQKADLEILNADVNAIDRAEIATINLREIFTQYFEKETEQEKYNFYSYKENFSFVNYKKLKTNMEELLRCLDKLYRSGRVEEALIVKGKKEKYLFLVAQLAYVCNALSDENVYNYEGWVNGKGSLNREGALIFDNNWTIDGKTINQILGDNIELISDNTIQAYPLQSGYPIELVEPDKPLEVEEPTIPKVVNKPVKPVEVSFSLTEPTIVTEPIEPVVVEEPTPYVVNENLRKIVNDYNNKTLIKRDEFSIDQEIKVESILTKNFKNTDQLTIEFFDNDGNLIGTESTESGSYIVFPIKPKKNPDKVNKEYVFSHWAYEDGTELDLNEVKKNGFVYPVYQEIRQEYTVTWDIGNNKINETYYYGDTPSFKGEIKKEPSGSFYYEFYSWDRQINIVNSDITYKAIFNELEIVPYANNVIINDNTCNIVINEIDNLRIDYLLNIYNDLENIKIETSNFDLILGSTQIEELKQNEVVYLDSKIIKSINNEISVNVNLLKENKDIINLSTLLDITYFGKFDKVHTTLVEKINDEYRDIKFIFNVNNISFKIYANSEVYIYNLYNVNYATNEMVSFNTTKNSYKENSIVNVNINNIALGKKIDSMYYVNSKNEKVIINDKSFFMPNDDIYIGVNVSDALYVITFMDNDNVISTKQYKYNEDILVPANPTKLSDENYSYNFVGWMEDGSIVDVSKKALESHTYVASFEAVESNLGPLDQVGGKIIPTIIIVSLMIICIPIVLIYVKRKRIQKIS